MPETLTRPMTETEREALRLKPWWRDTARHGGVAIGCAAVPAIVGVLVVSLVLADRKEFYPKAPGWSAFSAYAVPLAIIFFVAFFCAGAMMASSRRARRLDLRGGVVETTRYVARSALVVSVGENHAYRTLYLLRVASERAVAVWESDFPGQRADAASIGSVLEIDRLPHSHRVLVARSHGPCVPMSRTSDTGDDWFVHECVSGTEVSPGGLVNSLGGALFPDRVPSPTLQMVARRSFADADMGHAAYVAVRWGTTSPRLEIGCGIATAFVCSILVAGIVDFAFETGLLPGSGIPVIHAIGVILAVTIGIVAIMMLANSLGCARATRRQLRQASIECHRATVTEAVDLKIKGKRPQSVWLLRTGPQTLIVLDPLDPITNVDATAIGETLELERVAETDRFIRATTRGNPVPTRIVNLDLDGFVLWPTGTEVHPYDLSYAPGLRSALFPDSPRPADAEPAAE